MQYWQSYKWIYYNLTWSDLSSAQGVIAFNITYKRHRNDSTLRGQIFCANFVLIVSNHKFCACIFMHTYNSISFIWRKLRIERVGFQFNEMEIALLDLRRGSWVADNVSTDAQLVKKSYIPSMILYYNIIFACR